MREHRISLFVIGALVAAVAAVPPPAPVAALTTYVVNSTLDEPWDGTPGVCSSTPSGQCTLRAALEAHAGVNDDLLVDLSTLPRGSTITTGSLLTIPAFPGQSVELRGSPLPDRRVLIQAASPTFGVLRYDGLLDSPLAITGVAVRGGRATDGAGLWASGPVTLRNFEASENFADGGNGGGIHVEGWTLDIFDSHIFDNEATRGGGIDAVTTTLNVVRTEVSDNAAVSVGGGIWVAPRVTSQPQISQSSLRRNISGSTGGAISCETCGPDVHFLHLDDVSIEGIGGDVVSTTGDVVATNVTVSAIAGNAIDAVTGDLTHTTITGDAALTGEYVARSSVIDVECSTPITVPAGESVITDCATAGTGEVIGSPFTLGLFAPIGGVRTGSGNELPVAQLIAPSNGAPCRAPTDARGLARPASGCEHGAVESTEVGPDLTLSVTSNADTHDAITGDGICADALGDCTLRAAVMEAEAFPSTDAVGLAAPGPITLAAPPPNGTYACGVDVDARCGDLDTTFLTVSGADPLAPVEIRSSDRVFDTRGSTTLENLDLVGGAIEGDGGVVNAAVPSGHTLVIRDSRLSGGDALNGGGLNIDGEGEVFLERVVVSANAASQTNGGGINVEGSLRLIATGLTVRDNSAPAGIGGGISIGSGTEAFISRSLVQGNDALEGGGLACLCTDVELAQLTISGNSADFASAIRYSVGPGTPPEALRLTNVSVLGNTAQNDGGVVVRTGTTGPASVTLRMRHTTIAGNSTVGGDIAGLLVEPNTGTVVVAGSVLTASTNGADCNGDIVTETAVFTSSCTVTSGPPVDTRDPGLEPIVDVPVPSGGQPFALSSIPVARPPLSSPVVDATPCGPPTVALDVLGTTRPRGAACDAGSVEAIGIGLRLFPSSAAPTAAGAGIALADLPPSAVRPRTTSTGTLAPTVDGQSVRNTDLRESPLGSIPLGSIPLGSIPLGSIPLGSIPLGSIPLDVEGGWASVLEDTVLEDVPLQNVTLGEVVALDPPAPGFAAIELGQLDLSATPLGSIPLGSIAYATVPLGSIPLGSIGLDWCADVILPNLAEPKPTCGPNGDIDPNDEDTTLLALSLHGVPLGSIPLGSIPLGSIDLSGAPLGSIPLDSIDLAASPLGSIPLGSIPLGSIPLGSIPLGSIPLGSIPLGSIPLGSIPLGSIPLGSIPLGSIPLGSIPLGSIPLGSIPLGSIPLGSIPLGSIPLGSIPLGSIPLGSIPLGSIPLGSIDAVVDCQAIDCATATLGEAAARGAIRPDATLAALGEYGDADLGDLAGVSELDNITLAELGVYGDAVLADLTGLFGDTTIEELGAGVLADLRGWDDFDAALEELTIAELLALLPQDVLDGMTLGSLLQGVIEPGDYPWEDLDLAAAADDLAGTGGVVTFVIEVQSVLQNPSDYDVEITLPAGFRYVNDSLTYDGVVRSTSVGTDRGSVTAVLGPRLGTSQITVEALVPLDVGTAGRARARLSTTDGATPFEVEATGIDQVVSEAFEVNDTPDQATPLAPDTLYLTHLTSQADQDWFSIDVAQGGRLALILSNLDADFDAVLFGPTQPMLRKAAQGSVTPATDGGRSLLAQGVVPAVAPIDDIDTTPPSGLALVAVATNRGTTDERIDTTPLDAGRYYVRVTGYQGASSSRPYALRATLTPPRFSGACPAVERPAPATVPDLDTTLPTGMTSLFVVDRTRLATVYPVDDDPTTFDSGDVLAALDELTAAVNAPPDTQGDDPFGTERAGVLDLSELGGVQAAYDAWDADPCNPAVANGVVTAVGAAIDTVVGQHQTVSHVVIVGNDDQIPFARVRDATVYSNEREYAIEVGDDQSPLTAALALGYLLSDDPYADANPLLVGTRELFVPDLAVGRLVEQPEEIVTALRNYVTFEGQLDRNTALSTGYDFLADGADAVTSALAANGISTQSLIGDTWTDDDLDAALNQAPDVASVNAHFDHFRALPAEQDRTGRQDDLYTLGELADDTAAGLEGTVLFSMGCHAGLSVSDVTVSGLRQADWAQTITGVGGVFAGNTGYGYGDDAVVGATEDLMRRFATGLDGTLTIGQAMAQAKQQYIAATSVVTPFDEKVAAQVVVYGLPQLRLGDGSPQGPPDNPPPALDPATGLDAAALHVAGVVGDQFELETTDRGFYYSFEGDTLTVADQPVQPRHVVDVTRAGRELRGVLLTALESTDVDLDDPVYFTPAVDLGATAPEVSTGTTTFPTALQSVSRYTSPTGPRDQAVIIPGQFLGDPTDPTGGGTQRLFTSLDGKAYFAPLDGPASADTVAPHIARSVAVLDGSGQLSFRVEVSDESEIRLVTALYTDAENPGTWVEVPLAPLGGNTYGADLTVAGIDELDFFAQAVDAGGNVARSSNKGEYFRSVELGPPTITASGPLGPAGWFTGPVTIDVTPFVPGGDVIVTVNGEPAAQPLTLSADGAFDVVATTPGGPAAKEVVRIDAAAPTVEARRAPLESPSSRPVEISLLGVDAGSGVASITYWTAGAEEQDPVTVPGASVAVRVTTPGVTTVSAVAVDRLGNESAQVDTVVEIVSASDTEPPVVTCGEPPSGWHAADVVIDCAAVDHDGGLADPTQASFSLTTAVPDGTATAEAFTDSAEVCDVDGNCTTVGPFGPVSVDKADPVIDVRFPAPGGSVLLRDDVVGDVACTDAGSGVSRCTIGAIDTATVGPKSVTATAADAVGNTTTVTVSYRVTYQWSGFASPVVDPPEENRGKAGRTYPLKFALYDATGALVRGLQNITSIQFVSDTCGPVPSEPAVLISVDESAGLKETDSGFQYNWKTPKKPGCYQIRINLADGTTNVADFRLT
jgi:hypothetical protein